MGLHRSNIMFSLPEISRTLGTSRSFIRPFQTTISPFSPDCHHLAHSSKVTSRIPHDRQTVVEQASAGTTVDHLATCDAEGSGVTLALCQFEASPKCTQTEWRTIQAAFHLFYEVQFGPWGRPGQEGRLTPLALRDNLQKRIS